ncbi:MAG: penicillin-binding protein activator [Anaerolineae bacterium]|nr:penicillin-binding protein activator [Anaerolineae bacterium]
MKQKLLVVVVAVIALLLVGACRSEPVEITVIETVEVEKVVEKEVTVVETVEVEKEVTVVETVEVQVAAEPEDQEYTLGVVLPFTGSLGSFGVSFRQGIELAVAQMNEQLSRAGSNISFSVVSADTEGTPDGAAKAFQTVVQTSGAQVVVGPLSTSEVLGAKQFADENQIVIIAPASSGTAGSIPDDFIFRVMNPPDTFAAQAFAGIAEARGYTNVVILYVDDPFGNGLVDGFSGLFEGEVATVAYAPDPPDLSSEISAVSAEVAGLEAETTAVFCICFLGDAQKALQLAQVDPTLRGVDWMGIENLRAPEILEDAGQAEFLAEVNFTTVSFSADENPNTQPFIDAYTETYGEEPGPFTNYAFDAANVAMLSMLMAGNNGAAVKEVVPFVAGHYIGTQVQTYLDENGDQAIANLGIYEVAADASDFTEIGLYNGASGVVTLNETSAE